jgi:hypothetical protein
MLISNKIYFAEVRSKCSLAVTLLLVTAFIFSCSSPGGGGSSITAYCVIDVESTCVMGLNKKICEEEGYLGNRGYLDTECPFGYDKIKVVISSSSGDGSNGSSSSSSNEDSTDGIFIEARLLSVGGTSTILGSFVDLDNQMVYTSTQVTGSLVTASEIDIVYGAGWGITGDYIFSAYLFGDVNSTYDDLLYNGSTFIVPLENFVDPALAQQVFNSLANGASISREAIETVLTSVDYVTWQDDVKILANVNEVFVATTTENDKYLVAVKSKNGTTDITLAYVLVDDIY